VTVSKKKLGLIHVIIHESKGTKVSMFYYERLFLLQQGLLYQFCKLGVMSAVHVTVLSPVTVPL